MHTVKYSKALLTVAAIAVMGLAVMERAPAQTDQRSVAQPQALTLSSWAKQPSVSSEPWPNSIAAGNKLPIDTVRQLIAAISPNLDQPVNAVENFQFATLDNGSPYLVASVDFSGRELFYTLLVMRCSEVKCLGTLINSAPPHNLNNEIIASSAGEEALLVRSEAGGYRGGDTLAVHTYHLLAIHGDQVVDVTKDMLPWFKAHIGPVVAQEANHAMAISKTSTRTTAQATTDYAKGVYAEQVGLPSNNLSEAREWEQSEDPAIRSLALQVYTDSPNATGESGLQRLAERGDGTVSTTAASMLAARKKTAQQP